MIHCDDPKEILEVVESAATIREAMANRAPDAYELAMALLESMKVV